MNYKVLLFSLFATLGFSACNDEPDPSPQPTPQPTPEKFETRTFSFVDASAYGNWVYVNLETGETATHRDFTPWQREIFDIATRRPAGIKDTLAAQGSPQDVKIDWHIALRRERIKTNDGAGYVAAEGAAFDTYAINKDEKFLTDTISTGSQRTLVDMSQMMTGIVAYSLADQINPALSKGLIKTGFSATTNYNLSNRVLVLRTKDKKYFKLLVTDFTDEKGQTKGFLSFKAVRVE